MVAASPTTDNLPDDSSTKEDEEPYIHFEITTYPSDFTLSVLHEKWKSGEIVIPPFQRGFVWNIEQASALIESFLLGLPVPNIFFYIDEDKKSQVIDGQQRLKSVFYFFEGYFGEPDTRTGRQQVFRLKGLNEKSPYSNLTYKELGESGQVALKDSVLRAMNVKQLHPVKDDTSIYHIFERLNTGGTQLRAQEIRNCVFRGPFNEFIKQFNKENENWRSILGTKRENNYQKDVELLVRCISLHENLKNYEKPLKEHINRYMRSNQRASPEKIESLRSELARCMKIVASLGERPFHIKGPLNSAVLDSVVCAVLANLDKNHKDLPIRYQELRSNPEFLDIVSERSSDEKVVRGRFALARRILYP